MNNKKTPSTPAGAGRRRMLGVIVAAAAPAAVAAVPVAAHAVTARPGLPGSGIAAGRGLLHREGWLLAPSDR